MSATPPPPDPRLRSWVSEPRFGPVVSTLVGLVVIAAVLSVFAIFGLVGWLVFGENGIALTVAPALLFVIVAVAYSIGSSIEKKERS